MSVFLDTLTLCYNPIPLWSLPLKRSTFFSFSPTPSLTISFLLTLSSSAFHFPWTRHPHNPLFAPLHLYSLRFWDLCFSLFMISQLPIWQIKMKPWLKMLQRFGLFLVRIKNKIWGSCMVSECSTYFCWSTFALKFGFAKGRKENQQNPILFSSFFIPNHTNERNLFFFSFFFPLRFPNFCTVQILEE